LNLADILTVATSSEPTIDSVHRDIAFANGYRMELIKTLLGISAALFAFTVTFGPTLKPVEWKLAMWVGWGGLAVSMMGGIVHLLGWDYYYKSYRDFNWRRRSGADQDAVKKAGEKARAVINVWRRIGMGAQFIGFAVGVVGVGLFAGANIENSAPKSDAAGGATRCCCNCVPSPLPSATLGAGAVSAAPAPAFVSSAASAAVSASGGASR
jgi:hypothetical protein